NAGLVAFADGYAQLLGLRDDDRMALLHSPAFGAGIATLARALARGLPLCLYDVRRDGVAGMREWLDRERITVANLAVSVARELVAGLAPSRVWPHLRAVQLGGDATFADDFAAMRAHTLPHCRFLHQLASTEANIVAAHLFGHEAPLPPGGTVTVGKPFPGVRVEIRREDDTCAKVDEPGEIVVFNRYVSPGYWRQPALDRDAFVADPCDSASRGFRTGDLGRLDAQGRLHYVGRKGTRLKIRGYTVDLAELEAALVAWPDAARAAAFAQPTAGEPQLVACVETRAGRARSRRALMRFLAERLPRHMLPAEVRFVAALPGTANGKVDRAALPGAPALPAEEAHGDAPVGPTEAIVASLFAELLRGDAVGRDDDFFLSGGDSLLAAELQTRLQRAFGVRVAGFHEDATVAGIAAAVDAHRTRKAAGAVMPILLPLWRDGDAVPLFMVHGRQGQAFVSPRFMQLLGNRQPVWAFQARGLDGVSPPHPTIDALVADYVAAMRDVRPRGPYLLGGLCIGCYVAGAMARQLRAAGEEVLPLLLLDPPNRFRTRRAASGNPDRMTQKLRQRRAEGRIAVPVEDDAQLAHAIATAAAFDEAIARYDPPPYDGPVYVLASRQRTHDGEQGELRRFFTGRVKRYEVGEMHGDALDPRNPVFAGTLKRCLELIQSAATTAGRADVPLREVAP
ncbi:MAG: AMP-binding protein, partial [Proteobacteria bacterium]|nr:AMP-binding protein [Pseudomonadota bacterium]